jgi:large subunit ribosomal protein L15
MPLYRKVPKRGFTNPTRRAYEPLNVGRLAGLEIEEWTRELLVKHRLVSSRRSTYKILGAGDLERALVIHAHAFSRTAREKIERAGGRCEVIA